MPYKEPKYRVTFTAPQLHYLLELVELAPEDNHSAPLAKYLKLMIHKLELGLVSTSHTTAEKVSLEEKLGMIDREELQEAAYIKWQKNPLSCTAREIIHAKTYMFENDMMTAAEEEAFEAEMFNTKPR